MSDLERPFLVLPPPRQITLPHRPTPRGGAAGPNKARQVQRLTPQFAALQADPRGVAPEQVLVFETNGPASEFYELVARTPGLEWLADEELRDLDPDEDFHNRDDPSKPVTARIYLVMTNQVALGQLLSAWNDWSNRRRLPETLRAWRDVFAKLRVVRRWNVQDRLEETGILGRWRQEKASGFGGLYTAEIELWHRLPVERATAVARVRQRVEADGGSIVDTCDLEPIAYSALLARLPLAAVDRILADHQSVELVRCDDVRLFRPGGQGIRGSEDDRPPQDAPAPDGDVAMLRPPVIGLLDGLPLENHALLAHRLMVDDPDGCADLYEARHRQHGTAMASLILHGDLGAGEAPAPRKLYVHPVLQPHPLDPLTEAPPGERIWVDVIHRAVRRALEADGREGPVAPTVRVFNASIGDGYQPFIRSMSALARLLDWLSWKYGVLFIVSAGNHHAPIAIQATETTGDGVERAVLRALHADHRHRRLLAPAETLNGITVGSTHEDAAGLCQPQAEHEALLVRTPGVPSPISGLGRGYRRAVKPELLMPGGRCVFVAVHWSVA